jgi:hypothetical protein
MLADDKSPRCLDVALYESLIFSAIKPTDASFCFFNKTRIDNLRLFAKDLSIFSSSFLS